MGCRKGLFIALNALVILFTATFTRFVNAELVTSDDSISWIMKLSGTPKIVEFVDDKHLFFASKKDVLGCINPTIGKFVWRRIIDGGVDGVKYSDGWLITTSRNSEISKISCWHPSTGTLNWDAEFKEKILHLSTNRREDEIMKVTLVLENNQIVSLSLKDGVVLLKTQANLAPAEGFVHLSSEVCGSELKIYSINMDIHRIDVAIYNVDTISHLSTHSVDLVNSELTFNTSVSGIRSVYAVNGMLFNTSEKELKVANLRKDVAFPFSKDSTLQIHKHNNLGNLLSNELIIRTEDGFWYSSKCGLKYIDRKNLSVPLEEYTLISFNSHKDELIALATSDNSKLLNFQLFSGSGEIASINLDVADIVNLGGPIKSLYFNQSKHGDIYIYLIAEDGSTYIFENSTLKMSNPEYLTEATSVLVMDPSEVASKIIDSTDNDENSGILNSYLKRLKTNINSLLGLLVNTKKSMISQTVNSFDANVLKTLDSFGFNKIFIFITKDKGITSISSLNGQFLWRMYYPDLKIISAELIRTPERVHPVIIATVADPEYDNIFYVIKIDSVTGKILDDTKNELYPNVNKVIVHDVQLSLSKSEKVVILISEKDKVYYTHNITNIPSNILENELKNVHTFYVSDDKKYIEGYKLSQGNLIHTWTLKFPDEEVVADIGSVPMKGPVASIGYLTNQEGAIYKYLNPNVLAIATLKTNNLPLHSGNFQSSVTLYFIDAISGVVLHRIVYRGAGNVSQHTNTIKVFQNENWALLYFWNHGVENSDDNLTDVERKFLDKLSNKMARRGETHSPYVPTTSNRKGFELTIHELYESVVPETRMPGKPVVLSQSYAFESMIDSIGVTKTRLGITVNEILVALPSNQILGISKVLLDAKRPINKTNFDTKRLSNKELPMLFDKSLPKYEPLININPYNILFEGHKVLGVQEIKGISTRLESTSVVLSYGIDILYETRSPSGRFDRIGDKFNKNVLVMTILVLFIGTRVASYFAQRNKLFHSWK